MAYFPDLTEYSYISWYEAMHALNIGWLDDSVPFETGEVAPTVIAKLKMLCDQSVMLTRGIHTCPYCTSPTACGNGEIRVVMTIGTVYAAPTLVYHYVLEHRYQPPEEFLNALEQQPMEQHLAEMRMWDEYDL